jgi:cytochrome bd-type quinol oxidase subunit 2
LILGDLIQGIKVENGAFAGGAFDWATPFSVLCGFGVLILAYVVFIYWVFRGKVREGEGYH